MSKTLLDELIVGFKGETLGDKDLYFVELLAIRQIHHCFPPSNFCTTYMVYGVSYL